MITTYELKNRPTCRFFYKIPYFIKNLILLLGLACIMVPVYIVHFRRESIGVTNIYKLLAGLNSRTFNYLEEHAANSLNVKKTLKMQTMTGLTTQKFYTECVSYSRACLIPHMANAWSASTKWPYENNGYAYLANKLAALRLDVFVDGDTTNDKDSFAGYSFKSDTIESLEFKTFLKTGSLHPTGTTAREMSDAITSALQDDIIYPEFYHEYGEFENLELTMGQIFSDNAHYDHWD